MTVQRGHVGVRDFPVARLGNGSVKHYVDDYRYDPGRTLCGRPLGDEVVTRDLDLPLCVICARSEYPTEAEARAYNSCTDCGTDTAALGETAYQLRPRVWEQAYPGYNEGIGVGSSRPCIGCLEERLGRALTSDDFTSGEINSPTPAWHSDRLIDRLTATLNTTTGVPRRDA